MQQKTTIIRGTSLSVTCSRETAGEEYVQNSDITYISEPGTCYITKHGTFRPCAAFEIKPGACHIRMYREWNTCQISHLPISFPSHHPISTTAFRSQRVENTSKA